MTLHAPWIELNWILIELKKMGCKLIEKVLKICLWILVLQYPKRHISMPLQLGMGWTHFELEFGSMKYYKTI
jgi:hypothetical protein